MGIELKAFKVLIKNLFQDNPDVSIRDRDLEVAFERADADNSKYVDEDEFITLFEDVKAGKVAGLGLFSPRKAEAVLEFSGEAPESWNRYYSQKKESWFLYNHTTGEMFWESKRLGDRWEQYMAPSGQLFFLNTVNGDVSLENPVLNTATDAAILEEERRRSSINSDSAKPAAMGAVPFDEDAPNDPRVLSVELGIDEDEVHKGRPQHTCMADPSHPRRMAWDFFVVIPLLAYLAVVMPFKMCFGFESKPMTRMFIWEVTIDIIFIGDIFLNFRTGYMDSRTDELVMAPGKVAKNYLTSWFPLDFVSGIPFGLLDMGGISALSSLRGLKSSRVLKALRVLRFLKLTRLLKGTKILQRIDRDTMDAIEDVMQDPTFRSIVTVFKISVMISYTTHLLACFFVLVGRMSDIRRRDADGYWGEPGNWPEGPMYWRSPDADSWLEAEGWTYETPGKKKYARSVYIAAYYFCLTTMTSVGYGDILPRNDNERAYVIILEAIGGFVYAMVIASLTSVVTTMDSNQRIVSERLDAVSSYVKNRRFPNRLGRRLRRYFRHFYSQKTAIDEQEIMGDLSSALRMEVSKFLVEGLMGKIPTFKPLNPQIWAKILPLLHPSRFERYEVVAVQGENCGEMFIILDGTLEGTTEVSREIVEQLDAHKRTLQDEKKASAARGASFFSAPSVRRESLRGKAASLIPGMGGSSKKAPPVPETKVEYGPSTVRYVRRVTPGETVNVLSVLRVWDLHVETVKAEEAVQSYAISSEDFVKLFRDLEHLLVMMRERTCECMFQMVDDPEAPTEFGAPLFMKSFMEIQDREEEYDQKQVKRKAELEQAKKSMRMASLAS